MTQRTGSLPTDLHIVSTRDLLLLQRGAVQSVQESGTGGQARSSLWSDGQDRVLDEMERRESPSHPDSPHTARRSAERRDRA